MVMSITTLVMAAPSSDWVLYAHGRQDAQSLRRGGVEPHRDERLRELPTTSRLSSFGPSRCQTRASDARRPLLPLAGLLHGLLPRRELRDELRRSFGRERPDRRGGRDDRRGGLHRPRDPPRPPPPPHTRPPPPPLSP